MPAGSPPGDAARSRFLSPVPQEAAAASSLHPSVRWKRIGAAGDVAGVAHTAGLGFFLHSFFFKPFSFQPRWF